jgi:two-component system, NarL family, sensor histidine kinase DevS
MEYNYFHQTMENPAYHTEKNRLTALHEASLDLVKQMSLDALLLQIATLARDQVDARYAAVGVIDAQGGLERFIPVGMTREEIDRMDHPPRGLGLIGELMHVKKPLLLKDISAYPNSSGFPVNHPEMTSFLGVPIRLGDTTLGQIYLTDKTTHTEFSDEDSQVIEILASYAAIAISNARMFQELSSRDKALTRRNQDLALLNDLASTLASSLDINEILEKSLTRVMENPQIAAAEIFFSQEDINELQLMHHLGEYEGNLWIKNIFEYGEGPVGITAQSGQPHLSEIPGEYGRFMKPEVKTANLCQLGCFPLTGRSGSLGVLCLATMPYKYMDEHEIQLFSAIGAWVGTAIENVRLFNQGRRLAILEERERIGMDLHDGVIQSIYAVGLGLEHARLLLPTDISQAQERINQAIKDLNHTIRDIRSYILDLRPRQMNEENLMDGIRKLVEDFKANTQVNVDLDEPEDSFLSLPQTHAITLFHICQEALANIAKHAHAHQVKITLWKSVDRVLMEIHDDGDGFDQNRTSLTLGHGLANMHTRANNVGGDVEISSDPGDGTTILVWVPYRELH